MSEFWNEFEKEAMSPHKLYDRILKGVANRFKNKLPPGHNRDAIVESLMGQFRADASRVATKYIHDKKSARQLLRQISNRVRKDVK